MEYTDDDTQARAIGAILAQPEASDEHLAGVAKCAPEVIAILRQESSTPLSSLIEAAKTATIPERITLLKAAADLTMGARNVDYGNPVENHKRIANIFNAITGHSISAREVAIFHQATKTARRQTSPLNRDHYIDNMAYVGIEYECAVAEEE